MTADSSAPLRASDDGHFLLDPAGDPFFWLADTAWLLFSRLDRDEIDHYLADRASRGFTVVQAVLTGTIGGLTTRNRYGETPFVDGDPARPNDAWFAHVDGAVELAARHGIRLALLPVWAAGDVAFGGPFRERDARAYGRWLGARYGGAGIIWVLGGDVNPISYARGVEMERGAELVDSRPVYDAMAEGILAGAPGDEFITYHPSGLSPAGTPNPRMSLYFGDRTWMSMWMLQMGHADGATAGDEGALPIESPAINRWISSFGHRAVAAEYRATPLRPVVVGETGYEDHPRFDVLAVTDRIWDAADVRTEAYHAVFAGAAGHTYGHVSVWDFHGGAVPDELVYFAPDFERPEWPEALDAPGARHMGHLRTLVTSRWYLSRIPDDSIVLSDRGTGLTAVTATRDRRGRYALVYLPQGGSVEVDTTPLAGTEVAVSWFDPRTGAFHPRATPAPAGSPVTFAAPSAGHGHDWILVLDAHSAG